MSTLKVANIHFDSPEFAADTYMRTNPLLIEIMTSTRTTEEVLMTFLEVL